MDRRLLQEYLAELVGTFAFVVVASGLVMLNHVAQPSDSGPLTAQAPGALGVAVGQGLLYAVLLLWSVPISGGYLNPAITLARWLTGSLSSTRVSWLLGAQIVGAVVAALALRLLFDNAVQTATDLGRPRPNPLVFGDSAGSSALGSVFGIELLLTFFLGIAIFGPRSGTSLFGAPWAAGAMLAVGVLFGSPLTGAGLNPIRWIGPTFWAVVDKRAGAADGMAALAFVGGPIVGAIAAALFCRFVAPPGETTK
jgi:glycerol uptake facilitator-like aquaporin